MVLDFTRNHTYKNLLEADLLKCFINGGVSEFPFLFDSAPVIPLLLVNNNGKIPSYLFHIDRDRGHNTHGYSKSCLGCFNGSLYIFSFTRSMGKKWALGVLLIGLRNHKPYQLFSRSFYKLQSLFFYYFITFRNSWIRVE